jgi:RNA recognition motif-containing protein
MTKVDPAGRLQSSSFLHVKFHSQLPLCRQVLLFRHIEVWSPSQVAKRTTMSGARHWEQDKDSTIYIGNLDERVSDPLVWELFLQAGRIVNVHLPKDRVTQSHQGYGFVEFNSEEDAEYAARIMNQVRLFGKPIRVNKASADKQKSVEVGAELFVGNLDPMVDERVLYDTFGRFGTLVAAPKVCRRRPPSRMSLLVLTRSRSPETKTTFRKAMALSHLPTSNPLTTPSPT